MDRDTAVQQVGEEVAAVLWVSTATVYNLCHRGELPHLRVSNAIRVKPEDLRWLGER
jgi:excisionase family DNA binding protein